MGFLSGVKKFAGSTLGSAVLGVGAGALLGGGKKGGLPGFVEDASKRNLAFADQVASRPYQAYSGQRVAGFTPGQTQGLAAVNELGGQGQGLANQGFSILGGIGTAADRIGAYQNPYTSEVVDRSLADLERQRQIQGTSDNARAIAAGAYGGSRQGVADSLTNEAFAREGGNLAANLRLQGFNTALGAAQTDVAQQQSLGQAQIGAGYGALQNQLAAGGQMQGQNQALLDQQYADFAEQRDYPLQQLAIRQSALGQTPYAIKPPGPDKLSQIAQGATTAAGIAALFSDKNMKQGIKPMKGTNILSKLEAMPVSEWEYKPETGMDGERHMGTMAQDFAKQFGGDGKTIDVATAIGANLLGVQQLAKKVKKMEGKRNG